MQKTITKNQFKETLKLYQFHQKRQRYKSIFSTLLPDKLYNSFFNYYSLKNARTTDFLITLIKVFFYSISFYLLFQFLNVNIWINVAWIHLAILFFYISSSAYQISIKTQSHKNDFLMLLLGNHKKAMLQIEIKRQLLHGYLTVIIPMTILTIVRIAIALNLWILIPLFIVWQIMVFVVARFIIIELFFIHYYRLKHSFFRDFLASILFLTTSIIIYTIIHLPILLLETLLNQYLLYGLGLFYGLIIILIGYTLFEYWLKKFINKNFIEILYPKKMGLKMTQKDKYFHIDSYLLKGLDSIEKEILIKDQKTFKRADRKSYYSSIFFGIALLIVTIQFVQTTFEDIDLFSLFTQVLIYAGAAFMIHMIATAIIKPYLSYSAEGSMVRIYQKLSISTRQIYRAKKRLFQYITFSITLFFIIAILSILWVFNLERLSTVVFGLIYGIGLIHAKLKYFIFLDVQKEKVHIFDYIGYNAEGGNAFLLGLLFTIFIPLGIGLFANAMVDAFGETIIYYLMAFLSFLIISLNVYLELFIRKTFKKGRGI